MRAERLDRLFVRRRDVEDLAVGLDGAIGVAQALFAHLRDAQVERDGLVAAGGERQPRRQDADQLLPVARALVVALERVERLGVGRIDRVQPLIEARGLDGVLQLGRGHARRAAQDLDALDVVAHQLGAPLVGADEPRPVRLRREDALERRLRRVGLGIELEHAQVRRRRFARLPEILQLQLAAPRVQIGEPIGARPLHLDQPDRGLVQLHRLAPLLVPIADALERGEAGARRAGSSVNASVYAASAPSSIAASARADRPSAAARRRAAADRSVAVARRSSTRLRSSPRLSARVDLGQRRQRVAVRADRLRSAFSKASAADSGRDSRDLRISPSFSHSSRRRSGSSERSPVCSSRSMAAARSAKRPRDS